MGKMVYAAKLGNKRFLFWDGSVGYLQNAENCLLNPDAFCNMPMGMQSDVLHMFEASEKDFDIEKYHQFRRLESVEINNEVYSVIKTQTGVRHVVNRKLLKCVFGNMGSGTTRCFYKIYANSTPIGRVLFSSEYDDPKYIIMPTLERLR